MGCRYRANNGEFACFELLDNVQDIVDTFSVQDIVDKRSLTIE